MSPRTVRPIGSLATEAVRAELAGLDALGPAELVAVLAAEPQRAVDAVRAAEPEIIAAVELVTARLRAGGRAIYVGAGSAGRLGVLDAAELGPTYDLPAGVVDAVIAGGDGALRRPVEGAEDDRDAGAAAVRALHVGPADVVIGISASGRTPFVLGAVAQAAELGAATVGLACNLGSELGQASHVAVELAVGSEAIAGSSRMNAGTAQKITLNVISTAAMVLLGKTFGNLMVDLHPTNTKLRDRAVRIVGAVAGTDAEASRRALEATGWRVKLASLIAATGLEQLAAEALLAGSGGKLRAALDATLDAGPDAAVLASSAPDAAVLASSATGSHRGAAGRRRLGVAAALVDGRLVPGDVAIEGSLIAAVGLRPAGTGVAAPGLVDLQVNGYAGLDAAGASVEELAVMAVALADDGVLAFQPTLISGETGAMLAALRRIGVAREASALARRGGSRAGALLLGAHVEGPFLAPAHAGTHPPERLRPPDPALAEQLISSGAVGMLTLAPELAGACELVAWLVARGVVVSLGHSGADAAASAAAIDAGATAVTHLFNTMPPICSRAPGLAGAALADPRVMLQLIGDGRHVADQLLRLAFAAAPGRCSLVSDATSLAGAPAAARLLGEVPIELAGGVARRADGTISGGASSLLDAVRHLAGLGLPLAEVLAAASERPAALIRRHDIGRLHPGGRCDLVVLEDDLALRSVVVGGEELARDRAGVSL